MADLLVPQCKHFTNLFSYINYYISLTRSFIYSCVKGEASKQFNIGMKGRITLEHWLQMNVIMSHKISNFRA